jgi:NDP-sugar pyrophosphorylase family protein
VSLRAYVLAGGLGTRLRSRIGAQPKALAPFGERPFLDVQLDWLAALGIGEVVLALGVRANPVIERIRVRGADALPRVSWTVDPLPLGTGGALALAARKETHTFLAVNGDTLAPLDLHALVTAHRDSGGPVTIACYKVGDAAARGRVRLDGSRVVAFEEKAGGGEAWVSGGLYVCEPSLLERIPANKPSSLEREIFPALLAAGETIAGYRAPGKLFDIGTPEGLDEAIREWRNGGAA